jgi:hypothetical protein
MSLTPEQQAVRQELNHLHSVLPDTNTDLNTVLLLFILDELRVIRSMFNEALSRPKGDSLLQLRDRIAGAKADHDDSDGS